MKVHKALRRKNYLASKLQKLNSKIVLNNSKKVFDKFNYSIKDLLKERDEVMEELIQLKTKLSIASNAIQKDIFRLSELKSQKIMIGNINTKEGKFENSSYRSNVHHYDHEDKLILEEKYIEFETVFNHLDTEKMEDKIEEKIIVLQDRLEEFNYSASV